MQDALLALTKYWTDLGALTVQPFNTEVGAGTLNPATVLRVLGPEPWRVAYVEPSVRPDDARYGENPNRLQTHTQFQVVLKPDPGDPQELYLGSLAALGIDVRAHDVRFVEDNWASPALGAWGLGWEVWLDGLEITQFTYFQQAGGATLNPVSVEITYGMERIMMALQGVDHFRDIAYAPGVSYGEVFGQAEYEMSRYYLDDADVATTKRLFEDYAVEAKRMLEARLPLPAHYCVLKCSHTFNILDARGAVSTTERARAFGRMRALSREVAQLWGDRRAELGHPLGLCRPPAAAELPGSFADVDAPGTLLFEIGTEELPAAEVARAPQAVHAALTTRLAATRLGHGAVRAYATPRRIVALVERVEPREPSAVRTVRGPRAQLAFDADGNPTKAAVGFARGQGVAVRDLQRIDVEGVEYVGVRTTEDGRGAVEVLSGVLGGVVGSLRADKNMRWSDPALSFSRPVRWLVAVLGDTPVPVVASALSGGMTTRVHRTSVPPAVVVTSSEGYLDLLAGHGIVVDGAQRRAKIVEEVTKLAGEVDGVVDESREAALLDEITNLVEQPTAIRGSFAERYLELPAEIVTTVMRKHQRFIPVYDEQWALLPYFIGVANGLCDEMVVRSGYEGVLRARYEDAAFFYRADLQVRPEVMKAGLAKLAFEERLGSMAARAERIAGLAVGLADRAALPVGDEQRRTLVRAASLAKFDLASHMVIELTSLAGTMAREYARHAGEDESVAEALYEMELPRSAGDELPHTVPGAVLALADRLDLLVGLFAVGAHPTGSSDPFGLRRAALGVLNIVRSAPAFENVSLSMAMGVAADQLRGQYIDVPTTALHAAQEFVVRRYEQLLLDAGADHHTVGAVLPLADRPARVERTLAELDVLVRRRDFADLVAVLQRVRRILPADATADGDVSCLREPAETALARAFDSFRRDVDPGAGLADFAARAAVLVDPITVFFDEVRVLAEEPELRRARLGLLAAIRDQAADVIDWDALGTSLVGG